MHTTVNPKELVKALKPHVDTLLLATAVAEVEREKCDKIQRRLLGTGSYGGDGDPKAVYLLPDEATDRYFRDLGIAYREAGYTDLEPGHCPALIAEHLQTQAEWELIKAAGEFFPGVTNNTLLCGVKGMGGLETRQKFIDLCIGMVVGARSAG